jgi:hypothetical protein
LWLKNDQQKLNLNHNVTKTQRITTLCYDCVVTVVVV